MSAKFTMEGSSAGAVKTVEQLNKALDATQKGAEGAVTPTKKLEEAAKRLSAQADPQERYNQKMAKLVEAVKGGGLELNKAETLAARYGLQLQKAGDAGESAFGPAMLSKISAIGGAMAAALGPGKLLAAGFNDIKEAIDKAQAASAEARRGMGSLRQLANSDVEYQSLKSKAEALFATGSTETLDQAAGAVFSLASAGQLDDKSFSMFAGLAQKGVIDPGMMAKAVRQYQSGFGSAEAGDAGQIVSKAFAASKYSPATVEALLGAAPQVAAVASGLGIGDEQSLASLSVLSASVGENTAATQIRSFLTGTAKLEGFDHGMSIPDRVAKIASENLSIPELQKRLGTIEGVTGFQLLNKNMGEIVSATKDIDAANTDMGAVTRRLGFTDPQSDASLSKMTIANESILKNQREASFEDLREGVYERSRQQFRESARRSSLHAVEAAAELGLSHVQETVGSLFSPEGFVRNAAARGGLNADQQAVLKSLERSAAAAEATRAEIEKLNAHVRGRNTVHTGPPE